MARHSNLSCQSRMSDKTQSPHQLKGKIIEVKKGAITAHVRIDVGGQIIAASITK
jgi:molybdopterin-binding protein